MKTLRHRKTEKESILIPDHFRMDETMAAAYLRMESTSDTFFLTGRAGTGKSTLLNYFRKNTQKKVVVLAPTGLAAIQVGGSTIHSFFGFPLRTLMRCDPDIRPFGKGHPKLKILQKMDTLVIDEVSMVRADILDAVDWSLKLNLNNDLPFGGKQVILIGDVFQLPPVSTSDDIQKLRDEEYENHYFFQSDVFHECKPATVELDHIYRQEDTDFLYLLNRVRAGLADPNDIEALNQRYVAGDHSNGMAIALCSVNAIADMINIRKLAALPGATEAYSGSVEGTFDRRHCPAPLALQLKRGAQVMMVKNDLKGRWVNGTLGVIDDLSPLDITVRFQDGSVHKIEKTTWENRRYIWDRKTNTIGFDVLGSFSQFPIRLAWAITIHKSQGLTFEHVIIDMGRGAFAHGQLYVALSRCKTLSGITLRTKIRPEDLIVDEAVERFAAKARIR